MTTTEISRLRENLEGLVGRDNNFAQSLLSQHDLGRKPLSDKQTTWITKLADRAQGVSDPVPTESVGDFQGVLSLMARAGEHLKYPKVRLSTSCGQPVAISLAGARSKYQGQVQVTDGGPYGSNEWFGRIDQAGTWTQSRKPDNETMSAVGALLRRLADDPHGTAAEHGKLTGCCCFCNRGLTDARSTEVGYGKICAGHFGLPWEKRGEAA
jgi:hypothetical protein